MFRKLFASIAMLAIGGLLGASASPYFNRFTLGSRASVVPCPTVERLQDLSALVTTRVDVADVQETKLSGWTGGVRVALLVKGDFFVVVDLSKASYRSVDQRSQTAVLVLPEPHVELPRLDHRRTRLFALTAYGIWLVVPGDRAPTAAMNVAYERAQESLIVATMSGDYSSRSKKQVERTLASFFTVLGWTVEIEWRRNP